MIKLRLGRAKRSARTPSIVLLAVVLLTPFLNAGDKGRDKKPKEVLTVASVKVADGSQISITSPRFYPGHLTFNLQNQTALRLDSFTINYVVYVSQKDRTILSTDASMVFNVPPHSTMFVSKDFLYKGDLVEMDSVQIAVNGQADRYRFKPGDSKKIASATWNSCGCKLVD